MLVCYTHFPCSLAQIIVEKVMKIVLLCESAQQFRALLMILQYHMYEDDYIHVHVNV